MNVLNAVYQWVRANPIETIAILSGVQLWLENLAHKRGYKWASVAADVLACFPLVAKLSGPAPRPAVVSPVEAPKS